MLQPKIKKTTLEKEVNEAHEQGKKDTTIN